MLKDNRYSHQQLTAAHRIRIALNVKGVNASAIPERLLWIDPSDPTMIFGHLTGSVEDGGVALKRSVAIAEYLDEKYPEPRLLPLDDHFRRVCLEVERITTFDTDILEYLGMLQLPQQHAQPERMKLNKEYREWILSGLQTIENLIAADPYVCGAAISFADVCLIPHLDSIRRLDIPLRSLPKICAVEDACLDLPAFQSARPAGKWRLKSAADQREPASHAPERSRKRLASAERV